MKGFCQCTSCQISRFCSIVIILRRRFGRQQFLSIYINILSVLHRHMAAAIVRHHLRQLFFTLSCFRMIAIAFPLLLFDIRVLIFQKILCFIGEIVCHAGHSCRPAARIKTSTGHDVKAAFISFNLCGQRDIFGNGIPHQPVELIPVHGVGIHIDHTHPKILRHCLRIILCTMLFQAMCHFMGKHRSQLILIHIHSSH